MELHVDITASLHLMSIGASGSLKCIQSLTASIRGQVEQNKGHAALNPSNSNNDLESAARDQLPLRGRLRSPVSLLQEDNTSCTKGCAPIQHASLRPAPYAGTAASAHSG